MALMTRKRQSFVELQLDIFQLRTIYNTAVLKIAPQPAGTITGIVVDNHFCTRVEIFGRLGILAASTEAVSTNSEIQPRMRVTRWSLTNLGWSFIHAGMPPSVTNTADLLFLVRTWPARISWRVLSATTCA
jgi:hypothetical protein